MGLDDRHADTQAHAHAFCFGREQRVKDARERRVVEAGPGVAHRDHDFAALATRRENPDFARLIERGRRRFRAVVHQVEHDLLELDVVARDLRQVRSELQLERNAR